MFWAYYLCTENKDIHNILRILKAKKKYLFLQHPQKLYYWLQKFRSLYLDNTPHTFIHVWSRVFKIVPVDKMTKTLKSYFTLPFSHTFKHHHSYLYQQILVFFFLTGKWVSHSSSKNRCTQVWRLRTISAATYITRKALLRYTVISITYLFRNNLRQIFLMHFSHDSFLSFFCSFTEERNHYSVLNILLSSIT